MRGRTSAAMPAPVSRMVTHDALAVAASVSVVMSIRARRRRSATTACSALIRMFRSACCSSSGSPSTARQVVLPCVRRSRCRLCARCAVAAGEHARQDRDRPAAGAAIIRCEPVKTSRLRTIFAARSASWINLPQLAAHRRRPTPTCRSAARDVRARPGAGCSSRARCRRRTVRATRASRTAPSRARSASRSRFEPRLSRDVAGDEHAPDRLRVLVDERRRRQQESAAEPRVVDRRRAGRAVRPALGSAVSTQSAASPGRRARASGRPIISAARRRRATANASLIWTIRDVAIGDDDEIDERVEGVFEQAPLPQDLLEQLDVLDADRQLVSELVREVDELHFVEVAGVHAAQDQRAERTPPAAERGDEDAVRQSGAIEPQAAAPPRAWRLRSRPGRRQRLTDPTRRRARAPARADRAATPPRCSRRACGVTSTATASSAVARFSVEEAPCENSSSSSRSRRCSRISRSSAPTSIAAANPVATAAAASLSGVRLGPDAHRQDRAAAIGLHGNQEGTRRAQAIDQFGKRVPLDQARRPDRHDLVHYLGGVDRPARRPRDGQIPSPKRPYTPRSSSVGAGPS